MSCRRGLHDTQCTSCGPWALATCSTGAPPRRVSHSSREESSPAGPWVVRVCVCAWRGPQLLKPGHTAGVPRHSWAGGWRVPPKRGQRAATSVRAGGRQQSCGVLATRLSGGAGAHRRWPAPRRCQAASRHPRRCCRAPSACAPAAAGCPPLRARRPRCRAGPAWWHAMPGPTPGPAASGLEGGQAVAVRCRQDRGVQQARQAMQQCRDGVCLRCVQAAACPSVCGLR